MIRHARKTIGAATLAASILLTPTVQHYDGTVLAKRYKAAHPEWSWAQGAFVTIPACWMLEIGPDGWTAFPDRICVDRGAYTSARWNQRYSGPGTPYAGSRL